MKRLEKAVLGTAILILLGALLIVVFASGYVAHQKRWFDEALIDEWRHAIRSIGNTGKEKRRRWYFSPTERTEAVTYQQPERHPEALTLLTSMHGDDTLSARIVDRAGNEVHRWNIDWYSIFPDDSHVPKRLRPKGQPGTHIHGAVLLDDGSLIFNFEGIGMARLAMCGEVLWTLPKLTHHSLYYSAENNTVWSSSRFRHSEAAPDYLPLHTAPLIEDTVLQVDAETGEVLTEISLVDVLDSNGYRSFYHMAPKRRDYRILEEDPLHLNDVEVFPANLTPGVFQPGDIMVSLRNLHTILVFDPETLDIRFLWIAKDLNGQHDPDFIDGNTVSVFDNNHVSNNAQSRIVILDARTSSASVHYAGSDSGSEHFFTPILGKHQVLDDGSMLITEGRYGRAFEIDPG